MPTALSTTKRKFSQLLDSISNSSSTSLPLSTERNASSPAFTSSPSKKPRTSQQMSPYVTNAMATNTTLHTTSNASSSKTKITVTSTSKPATNFAPWDRGQFLDRLKTYRHVDRWMGKPDAVNEVQWAKRGWSCVGKERVRCLGGCEKEVVVMLEEYTSDDVPESEDYQDQEPQHQDDTEDWREKAYQELIEKYATMIVSEHEGSCLWRRRGCDDTVHRLPLASQATAISNLRDRYDSLVAMRSDLPSDISYPSALDIPTLTRQAQALLKSPSPLGQPQTPQEPTQDTSTTDQGSLVSEEIIQPALLLSLFGWQAGSEQISGLVTCNACFRRLGLWLFRTLESTSTEAASEAPMTRLDVIGEHRDYCPWVNAASQNGLVPITKDQAPRAGWEILRQVVRSNSRPRSSDSLPALTPAQEDGATSRPNSGGSSTTMADSTVVDSASVAPSSTAADTVSRDEKDKERWARLKKLKQAFHVKKDKGKVTGKSTGLSQILTSGKG